MRARHILLVLLAAILLALPAEAPAKVRRCGVIHLPEITMSGDYKVNITRGSVTCRTARSVIKYFLRNNERPAGWSCFRGHGSDRWAAACSRKRSIVRAYYVAE